MTADRRIALNALVTGLRSLYGLGVGLLTARWLLQALGQDDFGLVGVVGGLAAFVVFFNRLLSSAVSRFFAVSVGGGSLSGGVDECRRWFTAAVTVHSAVPLLLVAVGYPAGVWAVTHGLAIPGDRLADCRWVWVFTCLSSLVAMMNVPFRAMFVAHQDIAELTVYGLVETTLMAAVLWYMAGRPGGWMVWYAGCSCVISAGVRGCMAVRAFLRYPECRVRRDRLGNLSDVRTISAFAWWTAFGTLGDICRNQGMLMLVNRVFGAVHSASVSLAMRVATRANDFSAALTGAFSPAIAAAFGAEDHVRMRALVHRIDRLGALCTGICSLPLMLEVDEVMRIWLGDPPPQASMLCACILATVFLENLSFGQRAAISASGRIMAYQVFGGLLRILALPLAWLLMRHGLGLRSVGISLLVSTAAVVMIRVYFAERHAGVPAIVWFRQTVVPIFLCLLVASGFGLVPRLMLPASLVRVALTVVSSAGMLALLSWMLVLKADERNFICGGVLSVRTRSGDGKGEGA